MNRVFRSVVVVNASLRTLSTPPTTQLFSSPLLRNSIRSFAGGDKKKGKKQVDQPAEEVKASDSLIPINIYVDGKDPEVLPDDQYPDWLWHMLDSKVSPDEWEIRQYQGTTEKDMIDIIRIKAARQIKKYNMSKAK